MSTQSAYVSIITITIVRLDLMLIFVVRSYLWYLCWYNLWSMVHMLVLSVVHSVSANRRVVIMAATRRLQKVCKDIWNTFSYVDIASKASLAFFCKYPFERQFIFSDSVRERGVAFYSFLICIFSSYPWHSI